MYTHLRNTPPSQTKISFGLFRYIDFSIHLDIRCVYIHNRSMYLIRPKRIVFFETELAAHSNVFDTFHVVAAMPK